MVKNKIKKLQKLNKITNTDAGLKFNMTRNSYGVKLSRESFSVFDLIKIADLTDTRLCFVDRDGNIVIEFNSEDLKE